jgi:hypothetical protein
MEIITLKVNTQSDKAKQLLSLIKDMVNDGDVQIQKSTTYNEVKRGIHEMKQGKVKPINELFE